MLTPDTLWGVSLALLAMLLYGSCIVGVSLLMRGIGSATGSLLAAAAGLPAGLLIAGVQFGLGATMHAPDLRALVYYAGAGVLSTYLGRWLVFRSIEVAGPSRASAMQSISPLITAVFGWVLLGQALGPLGVLGIGLGIVGLLAMSRGGRPNPAKASGQPGRVTGFTFGALMIGIASATAYAGSNVARAAGVHAWNEPVAGAAIGAVAGLAALLLAGRRQLPDALREVRANRRGAALYAVVGALQFVAQVLVIESLRFLPASVSALITAATPLVVMPISFMLLRKQENLTWQAVLGICITLAGIVLVVLYGRPHA